MVIQETTRSPRHNGVEPDQSEDQPGLEEVGEGGRLAREASSDTSATSDEEPEENDLNR